MAISTYAELQTALQNWPGQRTDSFWTSRVTEFITLGETDIGQLLRIRQMEEQVDLVVSKALDGGTVGGTGDAITLTPDPAITAYTLGQVFKFTAGATNTTATTVAISGLATKAVRKFDGSTALEANDIVKGFSYHIYYDGTQSRIVPPGGVPLPSRYVGTRRVYLDGTPKRLLEYMTPENFWSKHAGSKTGKPQVFTIENEYMIFGPEADSSYNGKHLYWRKFNALASASTNWLLTNAPNVYLYASLKAAYTLLQNAGEVAKYDALLKDTIDLMHIADKRDRHSGVLIARPDFATP